MPTWEIPVTSNSTRFSAGDCSSAATLRLVAWPTALGAIMTPSEPCSSTPKMISASSTSWATVTMLPLACAAAAITISSGIFVGSRNSSRLHCSWRAASHAHSRVSASTISTNRPNSMFGYRPDSSAVWPCTAGSTMTMSAAPKSSGSGLPCRNRIFLTVGGSPSRTVASSATMPSMRWCTASSMTALRIPSRFRTSNQHSFTVDLPGVVLAQAWGSLGRLPGARAPGSRWVQTVATSSCSSSAAECGRWIRSDSCRAIAPGSLASKMLRPIATPAAPPCSASAT